MVLGLAVAKGNKPISVGWLLLEAISGSRLWMGAISDRIVEGGRNWWGWAEQGSSRWAGWWIRSRKG